MSFYPFTAIVGQDQLKAGLALLAVSPGLGGALLRGEKGTAKSVAAAGLARFLPGGSAPVLEVPVGVTAEELFGHIQGAHVKRGLLAQAHQGVLIVGRVNLLPEPLLERLLEVHRTGSNVLTDQDQRYAEPCHFLLVAAMSPEEGELRPHFLDRFTLCVAVEGLRDPQERTEILERCLRHERDPAAFCQEFAREEEALAERINSAREALPEVTCARESLELAVTIATSVDTPGHRADVALVKTASALAALEGLTEVGPPQIQAAASLVLPHRMRTEMPSEPWLAEAVRRDFFTPVGQ